MSFDFKAAFDAVLKHLCVIRDKACESIPLLQSIADLGSSHETPQYNQICNFDELAALLKSPEQNDNVFVACLADDDTHTSIFVERIRDEETGLSVYTNLITGDEIDPQDLRPCPEVKWSNDCYQDADGLFAGTLYTCIQAGKVASYVFVPADGSEALGALPEGLSRCEEPKDAKCYESQEYTYGIDNTGTSTSVAALLCILLSDGSTVKIDQSNQGANAQWTPQMAEWGTNLQTAADEAGLLWKVETRYIRSATDLTGGGGFSGPPSAPVGAGLWAGGMRARYLNIQICPGQPVPVSAVWKEIDDAGAVVREVNMTTAGAILGPIVEYQRCEKCGESPTWYVRDKFTNIVRPATAAELPLCAQPCGTLALTPPPPDRDCTYEFDTACDNVGEPNDNTSWVNLVTRRVTFCAGKEVAQEFFVPDPDDNTNLVAYELIGEFVDCATGEPVALPNPPCKDCVPLGEVWQPKVNPALMGWKVSYWQPSALGGNAAPHGNVSDIFTVSGNTLTHVNGDPDYTAIINSSNIATSSATFLNAMGLTSNADTSGADQILLEGYYNFTSPAQITDTNTNTGERGAVYLQQCCQGTLEKLFERTDDSAGGDAGVYSDLGMPQGLHKIVIPLADLSAWMGHEGSVSYDGGNTLNPFIPSGAKPVIDCVPVVKCKDSGAIVHAVTGEIVEITEETTWHKVDCIKSFEVWDGC